MKKFKKKGYVLAIVLILTLVMAMTVTSAFTIVMRYMFFAKSNLEDLGTGTSIYQDIGEEVNTNARI